MAGGGRDGMGLDGGTTFQYVVAVFMYMRLLGYPASKITILTTYNGQRDLIEYAVCYVAENRVRALSASSRLTRRNVGRFAPECRDVITSRCAWISAYGRPAIVSTVDKYGGPVGWHGSHRVF